MVAYKELFGFKFYIKGVHFLSKIPLMSIFKMATGSKAGLYRNTQKCILFVTDSKVQILKEPQYTEQKIHVLIQIFFYTLHKCAYLGCLCKYFWDTSRIKRWIFCSVWRCSFKNCTLALQIEMTFEKLMLVLIIKYGILLYINSYIIINVK